MFLSRRMEDRLLELFQKGYVKGTVTMSAGNEATAAGMTMPLRPGRDVVSLLHRDFVGHLLLGRHASRVALPVHGQCRESRRTPARETATTATSRARRLPMISHLGKMPSLVVGGTWAARRAGEDVFGLAVIGDGGSSTGEIHETMNIASVRKVPVLFIIQNNHLFLFHAHELAVPLPASGRSGARLRHQWADDQRHRRLGGLFGGLRRLGDDAGHVAAGHDRVHDAAALRPCRLRQGRLRAGGNDARVARARSVAGRAAEVDGNLRHVGGGGRGHRAGGRGESAVGAGPGDAGRPARPDGQPHGRIRRGDAAAAVKPYHTPRVKNGEAVGRALDYLLENNPQAFLFGLDVGVYGSAFKTCKGLIERHGADRVMDMPLCESALVGFALGASQADAKPIMEFQFGDFSTEAVSQLGLNAGTWYFRTGQPAPLLMRLPCGGGLTMGAFHSGEYEGLWSRFPA